MGLEDFNPGNIWRTLNWLVSNFCFEYYTNDCHSIVAKVLPTLFNKDRGLKSSSVQDHAAKAKKSAYCGYRYLQKGTTHIPLQNEPRAR